MLTESGSPAVVGAARCGGELRVVDCAGKQAEAWIQEDSVNAVGIHVGDALVRVEPAGLAVFVSHRVGLDHTLPRPDRTDPADANPAVADRVLLDEKPFLAILSLDDSRRPVPKRGVSSGSANTYRVAPSRGRGSKRSESPS